MRDPGERRVPVELDDSSSWGEGLVEVDDSSTCGGSGAWRVALETVTNACGRTANRSQLRAIIFEVRVALASDANDSGRTG